MNHHTNANSAIAIGTSGTPSQYNANVRAIGKNQLMTGTLPLLHGGRQHQADTF